MREKVHDENDSLKNRLVYGVCWHLLRILGVLLYRLRWKGVEHVPSSGPVVVVTNHQSHYDPAMIGCVCRRRMRFMGRKSLFQPGFANWFIRALGAIPVDRDGIGVDGIKQMLRALKRGEVVALFPEGSRSWDGEIQPFMAGFVTLARRGKACIVPGALEGTFDALPRGVSRPRLWGPRIRVHFGPAISYEELEARTDAEIVALLDQRIREVDSEIRQDPAIAAQVARRKPQPPAEEAPLPEDSKP